MGLGFYASEGAAGMYLLGTAPTQLLDSICNMFSYRHLI